MTNENAKLLRIYLHLISFSGTKILSHTHHRNERAVSILSGGEGSPLGLVLSACRPLTAPPGGQHHHNRLVVQTVGGLTVCQICVLVQTLSVDAVVTCGTYLVFSITQNPVIHTPFFWSADIDCRVECMVQQHIHLDKPQGLRCCELSTDLLLSVYTFPVACGWEYYGNRIRMSNDERAFFISFFALL